MCDGIKLIDIQAETPYPVVSAYEFEFLKGEEAVRERLKGSTIYFILQRPLTYFKVLRLDAGSIDFEIIDGINQPLSCHLNFIDAGMVKEGEKFEIVLEFYKDKPDLAPPYDDVAMFKLFREDGSFITGEMPHKFLYEVIVNDMPASIEGEIAPYLEFLVHYIGKAWSQETWERLTGHAKFQKILTIEDSISTQSRKPSFEIAILLLAITGFDEGNMIGACEMLVPQGVTPILHSINTHEDWHNFYSNPPIKTDAPELTAEAEALLIRLFKPEYNDVKFDTYPEIKNGTRSVGYTSATLTISRMPILLKTAYRPAALMGDIRFQGGEVGSDLAYTKRPDL